jgi:hypothetical protein
MIIIKNNKNSKNIIYLTSLNELKEKYENLLFLEIYLFHSILIHRQLLWTHVSRSTELESIYMNSSSSSGSSSNVFQEEVLGYLEECLELTDEYNQQLYTNATTTTNNDNQKEKVINNNNTNNKIINKREKEVKKSTGNMKIASPTMKNMTSKTVKRDDSTSAAMKKVCNHETMDAGNKTWRERLVQLISHCYEDKYNADMIMSGTGMTLQDSANIARTPCTNDLFFSPKNTKIGTNSSSNAMSPSNNNVKFESRVNRKILL